MSSIDFGWLIVLATIKSLFNVVGSGLLIVASGLALMYVVNKWEEVAK